MDKKWVTPVELFENGKQHEEAAPPHEYVAILLIRVDTALVRNQGTQKFSTLYTNYESVRYIGERVGVRWDIDDVAKFYVFDERGRKACEAVSAELLAFGPHCSQAAPEKHLGDQKRQEHKMREIIDSVTRPYKERLEKGRASDVIGKIDLTVKVKCLPKVVQLSVDEKFRGEVATRPARKKAGAEDEFLGKKTGSTLVRLRAINEQEI